jgi:hypothetical protein
MAMNKDTLGQALYTAFNMDTALADASGQDRSAARAQALAGFKTLADTVIQHLTNNMEISNISTLVPIIPVQTVPATGTGATTATETAPQTGPTSGHVS